MASARIPISISLIPLGIYALVEVVPELDLNSTSTFLKGNGAENLDELPRQGRWYLNRLYLVLVI